MSRQKLGAFLGLYLISLRQTVLGTQRVMTSIIYSKGIVTWLYECNFVGNLFNP